MVNDMSDQLSADGSLFLPFVREARRGSVSVLDHTSVVAVE